MLQVVSPQVVLLAHTNHPMLPAKAARFCTSSQPVEKIMEPAAFDEAILDKVVNELGHESVVEHFSVSLGISGISRVTEVQLVRHRIASFSIKSGRYTKIKEFFEAVIPRSLVGKFWRPKNGYVHVKEAISPDELLHMCHQMYLDLIEQGVPAEDARYILPQATATQLILTMNARELLHFFEKRCCGRAQWEIRQVAKQMLAICKDLQPTIFRNAGPECIKTGFCREDQKQSCGLRPHYSEAK